jgi:Tfp pilus assembly protein PilN
VFKANSKKERTANAMEKLARTEGGELQEETLSTGAKVLTLEVVRRQLHDVQRFTEVLERLAATEENPRKRAKAQRSAFEARERVKVAQQKVDDLTPGTSAPLQIPVSSHQGPILIADELAKLASLQDDGVLTEDELAAQKARLLGQK